MDDEIARHIAETQRPGDLRGAENDGKPQTGDDGWQQTPDEVCMPFKMRKSAEAQPQPFLATSVKMS